ncbi:uncharacterized protein LOC127130845 [Lathyrus oleraceus]|uniref:uncharacterized protein LOC127130845 n=1 Tax=Pisum sativum TaxID=3888 RepID=UPI0021D2227F|nr:uncharacterized protein LOC127130845 [Pisum sativum]
MDPIKYIFEKSALTGRITHWQMLLFEYDIQYVTHKAIKESVLSEYLAHQPVEDYHPIQFDFPDKDIMVLHDEKVTSDDKKLESKTQWKLVFDGASNAMGHVNGVILIFLENRYTPFTARLCFNCMNNMAEYKACIMGIEATINLRIKVLKLYGDLDLFIYQVKREWETRDHKLILYHDRVTELTEDLQEIIFHHIP